MKRARQVRSFDFRIRNHCVAAVLSHVFLLCFDPILCWCLRFIRSNHFDYMAGSGGFGKCAVFVLEVGVCVEIMWLQKRTERVGTL